MAEKTKVSPRFYTQEGAARKPTKGNGSTNGTGVLTARQIAEYKRKARAKKRKKKEE